MKHYTDREQELYLNDYFAESLTEEAAVQEFCYFKMGKIRESTIRNHHRKRTLGTLFRKYDPIAFRVSKQDRSR